MHFLVGYAPLLDARYWLNPRPVPLGPSLVGAIFAFFGWFVVASVALYVIAHLLRKRDALRADIARRFAGLLSTTGLLGYLFLFLSYEQIPMLGMRFWFLLIAVLFFVWLARIVIYLAKDFPKEVQRREEKARLLRYLPKRK